MHFALNLRFCVVYEQYVCSTLTVYEHVVFLSEKF